MATKATQKIEEDLAFVREAVERRDRRQYGSIAIAVFWACLGSATPASISARAPIQMLARNPSGGATAQNQPTELG